MTVCSERARAVRFDSFEMDLMACQLRRNGRKIKIQPQPFLILKHLALRHKEPVLREELYSYLSTHGSYDCKHGLDNAIRKIRKALHDSVEKPRFVETLRLRGYRFLKAVEFIPPPEVGSTDGISVRQDPFLVTLSQLRRELFVKEAQQELTELFHRLRGLIEQHPEHPNKCDGWILMESIQAARSENNHGKHKISFDSAALVLEDPQALSICRSSNQRVSTWDTLGQVQQGVSGWWRPVILVVSYEVNRNKVWISSARKATPIERAVYEQARKKTDQ